MFPQSRIGLDRLVTLDRLYGSRSMMSSAVGWLADCAREFNVYLSCQLHVKLIGTPSTPHARRLGSVLGAKQIFPALAYVERENPSGGIFASTVAREISLEEKQVHFLDTCCYDTDSAGHCGNSTCC